MAGYIGSKAAVTQVDGYTQSEAESRYANVTGDTFSGNVVVSGTLKSAGHVVQTVSYGSKNEGRVETSSTSFTATFLKASISPTSTSSKILVFVSGTANNNATNGARICLTVYRDGSTDLADGEPNGLTSLRSASSTRVEAGMACHGEDSPNTTSSVEYKVYVRNAEGSATVEFPSGTSNEIPRITLMEIAQ